MSKHIIDKLVRDKILAQMQAEGKKAIYHHLTTDEEKQQKITEKLWEKYKELFEKLIKRTDNHDDIVNGISDMIEVLNAIAKAWKISLTTIGEKKKQKLLEKWGYETRTHIDYIEIEDEKK